MSIQFLRGTSQQRKASEKPMKEGQPLFDTTTKELYVATADNQLAKKASKIVDTNAMWLSDGEAIVATEGAHADLDDDKYKKSGNYYLSGADSAQYVKNFPSFLTKEAFILTVYAGNGLGYPCQRLRTLNARAVAERWFNSDVNAWMDWVPVSKDSYNLQSRQIYNKDKDEWEFYKKDKSTLYHLPTLTADDFPETSSKLPTGEDNPDAASTPVFFFCLLALLQPEYGKRDKTYGDSLVGLSNPNEQGNTLVYIYTDEPAEATITGHTGTPYTKSLPRYSSGMWIKLNGEVIVFGTTAPSENSLTTNYYCHKIDSRYCDNIYTKSINKLDDFVNTQDIDGKTHFYLRSEFDNLTTAVHFTANIKLTDTLIIPAFSKGFIVSPTTTNDFVIYTVSTDSSINYFYNDAGPSWQTQTTGSDIRPVYMQNGRLTACSGKVGRANQPIWMDNGVLKNCSGPVGDSLQPIYLGRDGALTACTYGIDVTNSLPSNPVENIIYFITED